jgi:hypothetical protein
MLGRLRKLRITDMATDSEQKLQIDAAGLTGERTISEVVGLRGYGLALVQFAIQQPAEGVAAHAVSLTG